MNERLHQQLHEELAASAHASVRRHGTAYSLGFWTAEGRQIAAIVEETNVEGTLRISDGGESWSELVMAGYTDPRPSHAEHHALERLCKLHRLHWDASRTEVFDVVKAADAADAIRRVTAASMAIDGWRAWFQDLTRDPAVRMAAVVRELVQLGPKAHWKVEPNARLDGRQRRWTAGARLARARAQAVVAFFGDRESEKVMERAMGWFYDVNVPLVMVVNENLVEELEAARELQGKAVAVPRLATGTAARVFSAAEVVSSIAA